MIRELIPFIGGSESSPNEQQEMQEIDKDDSDTGEDGGIPNRDTRFRDMIAPTTFIEESGYARAGEDYAKTLFIMNWPDNASPMYMHDLLYNLPVDCDISIHVSPREKNRAIDYLERELEKATAQVGQGVAATTRQSRQRRYENTQKAYDALTETDANLHDVSMYVTIRGEDKEDLRLSVEQMVREFRTNSLAPEVVANNQMKGMQSVSPIGSDEVGHHTPMISGAVGAMYPFGTTTVMESAGVDIGMHAVNDSPVTINRFERENGFNQITAGKIGSGKTFGTLLEIMRTKAAMGDDLIVFMLDPLDGFKPIIELMGGKEILVGGRVNINPMKIIETPKDVLESTPDIDPYGENKQNLLDFFDMLLKMQDRKLGESRDVLSMAIDETYRRSGITKEIATHSNESPTIVDLVDVLREIESDSAEYLGVDQSGGSELVKQTEEQAARLIRVLAEFEEGGQYENLGKKSSMSLQDEDIVYFNLKQQEGSGSLGLMMHLLLGEVYERAKDTDKKVMFCIDEAHYIMSDARSLDFLEQAVRHSRHYDLGINFITQTLEEFFQHNQSEAIAQQCSMRRIHRIESGLNESIMDTLNLNESHMQFIQDAEPGSEEAGFSEALYGVDEHGYVPIRMYPSDFEFEAIETAKENIE